jgi:hypothetical protein
MGHRNDTKDSSEHWNKTRGQHRSRPRRFPPPWTFEDNNNACFIVKDRNGRARWRMKDEAHHFKRC